MNAQQVIAQAKRSGITLLVAGENVLYPPRDIPPASSMHSGHTRRRSCLSFQHAATRVRAASPPPAYLPMPRRTSGLASANDWPRVAMPNMPPPASTTHHVATGRRAAVDRPSPDSQTQLEAQRAALEALP
jgi:hypothetical protein